MEDFDRIIQTTFDFICWLYKTYNWHLFLIVAAVVAIMIPINMLVKHLFKNKTSALGQRTRRAISTLLVYIVSFGVIFAYVRLIGFTSVVETTLEDGTIETATVVSHVYGKSLMLRDSLPIGTLAMTMWWIIKLIRDVGVLPIVNKLANSDTFKQELKAAGLDTKLAKNIYDVLKSVMKENAAKEDSRLEDYIAANQGTICAEIQYMLNLYSIDSTKISAYVDAILNKVNKTYKVA